MRRAWILVVLGMGLAAGCEEGASGGDAGSMHASQRDGGGAADAGSHDASVRDASTERDAAGDDAGEVDGSVADGSVADAGLDASSDRDAGRGGADGGPACMATLGAPCEDDGTDCGPGFDCAIGRCRPQSREVCGGFAGAPCTMSPFTECFYFTGADFGTCLTPAELSCVCASFPAAGSCS